MKRFMGGERGAGGASLRAEFEPCSLQGTLTAPGSKSFTHRALIAAALSTEPTQLSKASDAEDIAATRRCLEALGAHSEQQGDDLWVEPISTTVGDAEPLLFDCGESGSTLRFLLPVAGALGRTAHFTGSGRLPERPLKDLMSCLRANGMSFSSPHLPFTASGQLQPGFFELPGNVSSQFVSGLLFALPLLAGSSTIRLISSLQSSGYVDMTRQVLEAFGVQCVATSDSCYEISGRQHFRSPRCFTVEGDWSSAAFFLAAGALGGPVTVKGLKADSLQGDRHVLTLLRDFGARVSECKGEVTVATSESEQLFSDNLSIDLSDIPDLLPALAVVAATAQGHTTFTNAGRLRLKESDRLESTAALLRALGAQVLPEGDTLSVVGGRPPAGGSVESFGDHRIVMAAAMAAAACEGIVSVTAPWSVAKSYKRFYGDYQQLGGVIHGLFLGN